MTGDPSRFSSNALPAVHAWLLAAVAARSPVWFTARDVSSATGHTPRVVGAALARIERNPDGVAVSRRSYTHSTVWEARRGSAPAP